MIPSRKARPTLFAARARLEGRARAWRTLVTVTSLATGLTRPLPAQAVQPDTLRLSLPDARAEALRQNPDLLAARLDTAVASGQLRQAGLLLRFNPTTDVLSAGGGSGVEVGISQELELFNQQGARRAAGRAGLEGAEAAVANVSRLAMGEVDRAFYRLLAAVRRSALADEVLGLNRRLAEVAGRQLREGEISRLDYNLATIELGRSRARALGARRERDQGNIDLGRLLGLRPGVVILPVADTSAPGISADSSAVSPDAIDTTLAVPRAAAAPLEAVDSLTELALAQRPDLAERTAAIRQAEAQATAARRKALPNLVVRGTSQREAGEARAFRPGIGLALPLFNRNQGEVEARLAAAQQAALERAALTTRVRAEVASAVTAYQTAKAEVAVFEATVLVPARQNRQLSETAYREGQIDLPELLLIRNQAVAAELDYWDAWLAAREAEATLAEAIGENLPKPDAGAK